MAHADEPDATAVETTLTSCATLAANIGESGASCMDHTSEPEAVAAATSPESQLQLELSLSPHAELQPSTPPEDTPQPSLLSAESLHDLIGPIVRLLAQVVGESVRQSVDAAVTQMQQVHARERDDLAQRFEAALDRQDARLRELLEHQDARLKTTLAAQAQQHTEAMRALLDETLAQRPAVAMAPNQAATTEALAEFQETLRMGLGGVRSALERHHHEILNIIRVELRPLAQAALAHLSPAISEPLATSPEPRPPAPDGPNAAPRPPARASPARARPAQDERTSSQRLHAAIQDYDDADEIEDPEDHHRHSRRCRAPTADLEVSHHP